LTAVLSGSEALIKYSFLLLLTFLPTYFCSCFYWHTEAQITQEAELEIARRLHVFSWQTFASEYIKACDKEKFI